MKIRKLEEATRLAQSKPKERAAFLAMKKKQADSLAKSPRARRGRK